MGHKATFKQSDLTRAIKGSKAAGEVVTGSIIDANGQIRLTYLTNQTINPDNDADEQDKWTQSIENTSP